MLPKPNIRRSHIVSRAELRNLREKSLHAAERFSNFGILWYEAWIDLAKAAERLDLYFGKVGCNWVDLQPGNLVPFDSCGEEGLEDNSES